MVKRTWSVQTAQQLIKISVARLRRRLLEGAAKRGGNAGMGRRDVHSDDLAIHCVRIRYRSCVLQLHLVLKRANLRLVSSIS